MFYLKKKKKAKREKQMNYSVSLKKNESKCDHATLTFSLETEAQVVQFINNVYYSEDPNNEEVYQMKALSISAIYDTVKEYTKILEDKKPLAFAGWCSTKNALFYGAKKFEIRQAAEEKFM
jgi:predicted DNA-binding protein YlxM (UPF0122 family)